MGAFGYVDFQFKLAFFLTKFAELTYFVTTPLPFATFAFKKRITAKTHFVKPFVTVAPLWLKKIPLRHKEHKVFTKRIFIDFVMA
jgi:hypothetical protein